MSSRTRAFDGVCLYKGKAGRQRGLRSGAVLSHELGEGVHEQWTNQPVGGRHARKASAQACRTPWIPIVLDALLGECPGNVLPWYSGLSLLSLGASRCFARMMESDACAPTPPPYSQRRVAAYSVCLGSVLSIHSRVWAQAEKAWSNNRHRSDSPIVSIAHACTRKKETHGGSTLPAAEADARTRGSSPS